MNAKTIAWVLPHEGYDDEPLLAPLRAQGLVIRPCLAGRSLEVAADLRVLQADLFADPRRLRREYVLDPRPTLIVVGSATQEAATLEFIRPGDDVVRGTQPLELLLLRLLRLDRAAARSAAAAWQEGIDALTGLGNRRRWVQQLEQVLAAELPGDSLAVVMYDIDQFKSVNDRHGHLVGDQVLRSVAALLLAEAAPGDRIARTGGDEFMALYARYDRATIVADVKRVLQRLAQHGFQAAGSAPGDDAAAWAAGDTHLRTMPRHEETVPVPLEAEPGQRIALSASAGLAFVEPGVGFAELMERVEVAVFEAKSRGRNRLILYESLQEGAAAEERDLDVRHFENVTRVMTERMTSLVTNMGRSLLEAARREANQDALTLLPNRRYFDARLAREVEASQRHGRALSIALLDLDHFHDVNATYGYPTGDHVLRRFAEIARDGVRLTDWLARYGGEEFCLVMPDTDLETAVHVAERVRANLAAADLRSIDQRRVALTASVGVATVDLAADSTLSLVQRASEAVLAAKQAGRNRLVVGR